MKAFICRHGETALNLEKRWQGGRFDSALTGKGIAQARAFAEILKDEKLDAIFSSPLGRAKQTASFLREKFPNIPYFEEKALWEIDKGTFDGSTLEERKEQCSENLENIQYDRLDRPYPGGESYRDLIKRLAPFVEKLKKEFNGKTVAVFGHYAVNRMLVGMLLLLPDEKLLQIEASSEFIYEIILEKGKAKAFQLKETGRKEGLLFKGK
ncbi:MAG: histidine phosphatase family protein [Candidatus Diapherotrites archaeon]|uniref:Histidine phosphatase family protein n=1 Tax=Candidatus Iainarchaeum sp. TaxID=3101447 RepID=A0A938YMN5_9ARCH|nr:histidine phosphatase family protein [Candidatus Diapherotrites archaeon]